MWAFLTAGYACAVGYRASVDHIAPGIPTFAGFSAVLAVWLDFYAFFHSHLLARITVLIALFATISLNIEIITNRVVHGRALPFGRLAFTLIFAVLLYDKARGWFTPHGAA